MKSDIVESVFVPKIWTGKLVFADTLPKILRPKARSVNPTILSNAKIEFDRLCYRLRYIARMYITFSPPHTCFGFVCCSIQPTC